MRILITGAGGMLGQDVTTAARTAGHDAVALARGNLDITDAGAVAGVVAEARPDAVVNCAAWTKVDEAEADPQGATAVNAHGAGNVGAAAYAAGAWTIHLSTDYVFDGEKREPYVESDLVGPRSEYGRSKLQGERAIASRAPGCHTIVRSAWLFGAGGPCFPQTILRLAAERERLTVVDDQVGCPTFTAHLALAVMELVGRGRDAPQGILHVAGAGACSWFDFAREVVATGGPEGCEVVPVSSEEFPRPAPRPAYSVLRSEREAPVLPDWRLGLSDYLAARAAVGAA
jgi:dTDP-4-dehydrorhamnose reductase